MTEKTCNSCIHFGACSKWTDFPKQCGVPVCASFAQQSEWISVEDRMPEYGGMYLVYNPQRMVSKVVTARYSKDSNRWCSADACCYHEGITHWMPIPEPPKKKGGAE